MLTIIDVTSMVSTPYMSGIQRAVKHIVGHFYKADPEGLRLIAWDPRVDAFRIISKERFAAFFGDGTLPPDVAAAKVRLQKIAASDMDERKKRYACFDYFSTKEIMEIEDFGPDMTLFEIDGVWSLSLQRSFFLPAIKARGTKVVALIHDVLPVSHPQFFDEHNIFTFTEFLCAHLLHADHMLPSTAETRRQMEALCLGTDATLPPCTVVPHGTFFETKEPEQLQVAQPVVDMASGGPYILMVGTMEPRKNHAYTLDAFDPLFAKGYHLIFAGRMGWGVDELMQRIENHPLLGRQLFQPQGLSDDEITYLYQHAFGVAFPSHGEGFGLPIIEAMHHGVPVIASDIPVLREVGGEACLYVDITDTSSFVAAVSQLEDKKFYAQLKERIQAHPFLSWEESAARMREVVTPHIT